MSLFVGLLGGVPSTVAVSCGIGSVARHQYDLYCLGAFHPCRKWYSSGHSTAPEYKNPLEGKAVTLTREPALTDLSRSRKHAMTVSESCRIPALTHDGWTFPRLHPHPQISGSLLSRLRSLCTTVVNESPANCIRARISGTWPL